MAAPSIQDLFDAAKAELILRRPDLVVAEGDISEMLLFAIAAGSDAVLADISRQVRDTFLDGASGDALSILVDDHFGIQRFGASASLVTVDFTRASAAAGAGTIPAGTQISTAQGATDDEVIFTTDVDAVFGAAALGPISVTATAVEGGLDGNVAAATIDRIIDTIFDDTITVTNPLAAVGGSAEESDEELRKRARDFLTTLRRGTLAALEFGAQQVNAVKKAVASEDQATATVTVYISDAQGNSNAAMVSAVETELEDWRSAGTFVTVVGGVVVNQPIDITLTVKSGVVIASIADTVRDAIANTVNDFTIGDDLFLTQIKCAALLADPGILDVTVNTPAADVVTAANELIRTSTSTITVA